ncbi:MAG TPA: TIGR04563 family protein [Polyangia bacterium]
MSSQKKKVTLYFNSSMLLETQKEALRQDRSVSWIIQAAWRLARDEVRLAPAALSATPAPASDRPPAEAEAPELDDSTTPPPVLTQRPVSRL